MAKSSINFAKGSSHSFQHNDRSEEIEPHYLLPVEHRLENECNRSAVEAQKMFDDLFENAKENYSKTYGQKFQGKKENANWEALINLNKEHTIKDVERLVREIEKETGFKAVQISIHRDEGHINEKTGHPIYNLHAHVNFFTLDPETGRQQFRLSVSKSDRERIRKEHGLKPDEKIPRELVAVIDKNKLSKLQDITARELGMERGERGSTKVRLGHNQYRATEQEKEKLLEKIEELQKENTELRYSFRDMQKQITALDAPSEDKKELHRLNTEINKMKIEGATKDLKISELEVKIKEGQSLSEKYATLPFKERMAMRLEMREALGENDELKSAQEEIKALKEAKTEIPHEPINARLIGELKTENEILKITNSVLENELKATKSAPVPKGENEASRQIEKYLEAIPKSVEIHSTIADLDVVRFETRAEAKEKNYQHGEKYAKHILDKHTNIVGKVDKEALVAELGKEFKETAGILSKGQEIVKDFKSVIDRTKSGFSNTLKTAEKAFKDVFQKITGKSTEQINEQRKEQERAIQQEKIKQAEAQKAKEPEQPKRSQGMGRGLG